jgi:hypothetical protein
MKISNVNDALEHIKKSFRFMHQMENKTRMLELQIARYEMALKHITHGSYTRQSQDIRTMVEEHRDERAEFQRKTDEDNNVEQSG